MIVDARVQSRLLGRRVVATAFCTQTLREVAEPLIGCGNCHTGTVTSEE
jgi:hypothetical protein